MKQFLINAAAAKTRSEQVGEHFAYTVSDLASALGSKAIGANLTRVPPGKAAFPFHHHYGNEEHFFVVSGSGTLRVGTEVYPVKPHDYMVHLPGGPDRAHQLINTGSEDLVYLAISTLATPDVVGYPDSGKTGVRASAAADARFLLADSSKLPRTAAEYWRGEDGAQVAAIVSRGK